MSALKPRGGTRAWGRIRRIILDRDGYLCQVPKPDGNPCHAAATTVDHIVPRVRGGDDDLANLRAACVRCNYGRGDIDYPPRGWKW